MTQDAADRSSLAPLQAALADLDRGQTPAHWLSELVHQGLDRLPLPGSGATLQRWQALCLVAQHDLSLAKLYEGHTDALAVMAEVDPAHRPTVGATWGMWAAEPPEGRAVVEAVGDDGLRLTGAKCWCSGAAHVSHGLLTAWHADGRGPVLVRLALDQPGVRVSSAGWQAVGMAASVSIDMAFDGALGERVGGEGAYLQRPGFWQGGGGIAACWQGGAMALAAALLRAVSHTPAGKRSPLRLAALGKVGVALQSSAALLRETAAWIDDHPTQDASTRALALRLTVERNATLVLDEVGRALGATPFCRDAAFAQMAADLPVYLRQSHAERDFAALGERLASPGAPTWAL